MCSLRDNGSKKGRQTEGAILAVPMGMQTQESKISIDKRVSQVRGPRRARVLGQQSTRYRVCTPYQSPRPDGRIGTARE
jgi:hypothetical protein